MIGIYKIENLITNSIYIGSSKNMLNRWKDHRKKLRRGIHENSHLQHAWDKYGEVSFLFSILENRPNDTKENLLYREQEYLDLYMSKYKDKCYNISTKAGSGPGAEKGTKPSLKTNQAASKALKGNKHAVGAIRSKEYLDNMSKRTSGERNPMSKLTWDIVNQIRTLWCSTKTTKKALGLLFNVNPYTISRIIRKDIWK